MDKNQVWTATLKNLSEKVSKMEFHTWFRKIHLKEISGAAILFACPTEMNKNWMETKYQSTILINIQKVLPEVEKIFFEVDLMLSSSPEQVPEVFAKKQPRKLPNRPEIRHSSGVDSRIIQPQFTLDNFVVGEENKFAHAVCTAVSETPINEVKKYNPLYIHGGVGLGKTHLLQATANEILRRNPDATVLYTTAERFTNDIVNGIASRKMDKVRKKYRKADVLIIDDVQFLNNKNQTQIELFNTFNDLRDLQKQMVFAADRPPVQLENMMDRLTSRLGWGLIIDVKMPGFETKNAIINEKAKEKGIILTPEVQEFIATNIRRSLRELENILNKISIEIEILGISPTIQSVGKIFREINPDEDLASASDGKQGLAKSSDDIITFVSDYFQIPATDLLGKSRKQEIVTARQISWLLCKEILKMSYESIGQAFNGKNHTTVMHGIKKIERLRRTDSSTARHIHALKKDLGVR